MPELSREQIEWAYRGISARIASRHIPCLTTDDLYDLKQEVMMSVVRKYRSFDPSKSGWKTFLWMVIDCAVKSALRKKWSREWSRGECEFTDEMEDAIPDTGQDVDAVHRLIDELFPEPLWNRMLHLRVDGHGSDEVGRMLGYRKTVWKDIVREMKRALRERLDEYGKQ